MKHVQNEKTEKAQVLKMSFWVLQIYFRVSKTLTITKILAASYGNLTGLINAFVIGVIINRLITLFDQDKFETREITVLVVLIVGVYLIGSILGTIETHIDNLLRDRVSFFTNQMLYSKLNDLSIEDLEDPEFLNKLNRYNEYRSSFEYLFANIIYIIIAIVSFLVTSIGLITVIPAILPVIIFSSLPRMWVQKKYIKKLWQFSKDTTVARRKAFGVTSYMSNSSSFQEIKITNSYDYFLTIFQNFVNVVVNHLTFLRLRWIISLLPCMLFEYTILGLGFYLMMQKVANEEISIGATAFYISALYIFSGQIRSIFGNYTNASELTIRLSEMKTIFDQKPKSEDGTLIMENTKPPLIEFRDVSFKYPNSKKLVLKDINLIIKPGEKIALVGENGAGKTTLIKLITRFHKATKGEILINGININEYTSESLYKNLGVLFQDYNIYSHLTAKENISIGDITRTVEDKEIFEAAKKADAYEFIQDYPNKFDTVLSEKYEGGIRPSTGQWQKIAIARFFYRNSPLLILDEPTASIDAVAEANIFNRIYEFIKDKTVMIVSHRFSTVRNADKIFVLNKGEITEVGTHEELVKKNGTYAKAFRLQAKGYIGET